MKLPFQIDLSNKVCVVTGGGGILCSMFAKAIALTGAKVAILDLNEAAAQKVADEIVADGGTAIGVAANVLETESLEQAKAVVNKTFGSVDILINGAGGNHPSASTTKEYFELGDIEDDVKSFFDIDEEGFRYVLDLNFAGTMLPTQAFARDMVGREGCTIINVSSMNAFTPLTKIPAYSGAKAAISNFTQWLAVHFSRVGIRCNAIAPGFFLTPQNYALMYREDGTPTERSGKIIAGTPMGRFGKPEELVGTLLFLVDEQASGFVNGVVIPVDGGFSAYSGV